MIKRTLWYGCLILLCCSVGVFAVNAARNVKIDKSKKVTLAYPWLATVAPAEVAPAEAKNDAAPRDRATATNNVASENHGLTYDDMVMMAKDANARLQSGTERPGDKDLVRKYMPVTPQQRTTQTNTLDDNGGSYFIWTGSMTIPDGACPAVVTAPVTVAGLGNVLDIQVKIDNLTMTYDGDLRIWLQGPTGIRQALCKAHGDGGDNFVNTVFSDSAATAIGTGTAPFTGTYRPDSTLTVFDGTAANGVWSLVLCDGSGQDVGTLTGWRIQILATPGGAAHDYAVTSVTSPVSGNVAGGSTFPVSANVTNFGTTTEGSPIKYQFDGGAIQTETIAPMAMSASVLHTFATSITVPTAPNDYILKVWTDLATDVTRLNDTVIVKLTVLSENCDLIRPLTLASHVTTVSGSTAGAVADCPDTCVANNGYVSAGPDLFFSFTVPDCHRITLVLEGGDMHLAVYPIGACCGAPFLCNDDIAGFTPLPTWDSTSQHPTTTNASYIAAEFAPGTYNLRVAYYGTSSGPYMLTIYDNGPCPSIGRCCYGDRFAPTCEVNSSSACAGLSGTWAGGLDCSTPCPLPCVVPPVGAVLENEPCPTDINGGCNSDVPVFSNISCGDTIWGSGWNDGSIRDTDWYQFVLTQPRRVTMYCKGEFAAAFGFVEFNAGYDGTSPDACTAGITGYISPYTTTEACESGTVVTDLPAGTWWAFVGASGTTVFTCGNYIMNLTCDALPVARCCYGNPSAPSCSNIAELECTALSGVWTTGSTCEANPCPTCNSVATINGTGTYTGTTVGSTNFCPLRAGSSNVLQLIIPATGYYTIDMCTDTADWWDSYMYLTTECCGGTILGYDDDASDCGALSKISCIPLNAGTYYLAVTGFGSDDAGPYTLTVTTCSPCVVTQPAGSTLEGEPCPNFPDNYNGGCNSTPNVFTNITCGETIYGTASVNSTTGTRDTDWFRYVNTHDSIIFTWTVTAEFPVLGEIIDGTAGCPGTVLANAVAGRCTTFTMTTELVGVGEYWFLVAPNTFSNVPFCRSYSATLGCTIFDSPCRRPDSLTVYLSPDGLHTWLHFRAHELGTYTIYQSVNKNNDGDPRGGDPAFTAVGTVVTVAANTTVTWTDTAATVGYKNYAVLCTDCTPPPPVGRCCYNAGANCATGTLEECNALSGTWVQGLNCTDNPCPPNAGENCIGAGLLTGSLPITVSGTTVGAATDYSLTGLGATAPACWPAGTYYNETNSCHAPDVTYQWVVPTTGTYTFSMCGSSYDTGMIIYNYTCPTEPTNPADFICGDDDDAAFCSANQSHISSLPLTAGQHILIVISGYNTAAGLYELVISQP